jgi:hypothetical protein
MFQRRAGTSAARLHDGAGARRRAPAAALAALVGAGLLARVPGSPVEHASLPPLFDSGLAAAGRLNLAERTVLLSGEPVTKLLPDADPGKEVAVFGAVWINAPASAYVARVEDIERFEHGGSFLVTKRISDPPAAEDFAQLQLPEEDLADLRRCRVGDCQVKLGASALQALRAGVDWDRPSANEDANAVFRRVALEYVTGYRREGNRELAVYCDKSQPTIVANEFRSMVDRVAPLATHLPDLRRFLLDYPRATLPDSTDFLYWQETEFGLKRTIRISHLVILQRPDQVVVASKMLYASHYFWTALELRLLVPDPERGPGFWFVNIGRSRSDGLGGMTGRLVRRRVRDEVQQGMRSALNATRAKLEGR